MIGARSALLAATNSVLLPWDPSYIAAVLILDADDSATITQISGAVSQWNDKSGNNRHVSQGNSSMRPVVANAILNGRDVIRFDGIDDGLATSTALYTTQSFGIYAVTANRNTSGESSWAGQHSPGGTGRTLLYQNGVSTRGAGIFTGSYGIEFSATPNTQFHLFGYDRNAGFGELFYEGVSRGQGSQFNVVISLVPFALGNTPFVAALDVAEVICLSAPASTDIRQRIEGYLAHKWGLTANLPGNHPYKFIPPTV